MSIAALNWALDAVTETSAQKLVLIILANFADAKGRSWPSQSVIATKTCLSGRTVLRALAELEATGEIRREARWRPDGSRSSDIIHLGIPGIGDTMTRGGDYMAPPPDTMTGYGDKGAEVGSNGGDTMSGGPVPVAPRPVRVAPLTTFEPPKNHQEKKLEANASNLPSNPPSKPQPPPKPRKHDWPDDHVEQFWRMFPKRVEKKDALRRLEQLRTEDKTAYDDILAGAQRYADQRHGEDPQYTMNPARWLHGRRWEDESTPTESSTHVERNRPAYNHSGSQHRGSHSHNVAAAVAYAFGSTSGES